MSASFLQRRPGERGDVLWFLQASATLFDSGFPADEALETCREMTADPAMTRQIDAVLEAVRAGYSFSEALAAVPELSPPMISALVRAGEETGTLPHALDDAAALMEEISSHRENIRTALIYPAVLLAVSAGAVVFLTQSVLPPIEAIYENAGKTLPWISRALLAGGRILGFPAALAALWVIAAFFFPSVSAPLHHFREVLSRRFPEAGAQYAIEISTWADILHVLLKYRVPLPESLRIAESTAQSPETRRMMHRVLRKIETGVSPAEAFAGETGMPLLARRLITAGDRTGKLPEAFRRISRHYRRKYRLRHRRLLALIEPAAVLFAGLFAIIIAFAVILPVVDLGGLID